MTELTEVKALYFDVFGTVVDWRGGAVRELEAFGREKGVDRDWTAFADDWRGLYQPSMEAVRSGKRPWASRASTMSFFAIRSSGRFGTRFSRISQDFSYCCVSK